MDSDEVLSVRKGAALSYGELPAYVKASPIWGEWYQGNPREIRLSLELNGASALEGTEENTPKFYELARRIVRRRRLLSRPMAILMFQFDAAHIHLRELLLDYARLSASIGPSLSFEQSPVVAVRYPESYCHFDAFVTSLRSLADSIRFLVWPILGRECGLPRSLRTLGESNIPHELRNLIQGFAASGLEEATEYRDNSIHYAPPGAHASPWLIWSQRVIHAQMWLPKNPQARSLKSFRYDQKDGYKCAKRLLESTYSFLTDLFPLLDSLHRANTRTARVRNAGSVAI